MLVVVTVQSSIDITRIGITCIDMGEDLMRIPHVKYELQPASSARLLQLCYDYRPLFSLVVVQEQLLKSKRNEKENYLGSGGTPSQEDVFGNGASKNKLTLYTILLGVGGKFHNKSTLNQLEQLRLDHQSAIQLARTPRAHSIKNASKLATTGRAIEKCMLLTNRSWSQVLPVPSRSP